LYSSVFFSSRKSRQIEGLVASSPALAVTGMEIPRKAR